LLTPEHISSSASIAANTVKKPNMELSNNDTKRRENAHAKQCSDIDNISHKTINNWFGNKKTQVAMVAMITIPKIVRTEVIQIPASEN
jgi:hypothetical protein